MRSPPTSRSGFALDPPSGSPPTNSRRSFAITPTFLFTIQIPASLNPPVSQKTGEALSNAPTLRAVTVTAAFSGYPGSGIGLWPGGSKLVLGVMTFGPGDDATDQGRTGPQRPGRCPHRREDDHHPGRPTTMRLHPRLAAAVALLLGAAPGTTGPASAAWDNVFQVCCHD